MKTVIVSTKYKTVTSLLEKAKKGALILRSPEGHEFILAEIDDFNREIELTRRRRNQGDCGSAGVSPASRY